MGFGDFITAGLSFLGGQQDRKSNEKINAQNFAHQDKWNTQSLDFAKRQFETSIQTRVKDAQQAGIHPLYAMGMPGAGSPSFTAGGGSSGSGYGSGIANAGAALGRAFKKPDPAARELHDAQVANLQAQTAKSNAEALYYQSEARRGQNGVGLGFQGARGARIGQMLQEKALISGAIRRSGANPRAPRSSRSRSPAPDGKLVTDLLKDKPQDSKTYLQLPWGLGLMRLDKLNRASTGARLEAEHGEPGETLSYPGMLDLVGRNMGRVIHDKYGQADRPHKWQGINPKNRKSGFYQRRPGESRVQWYKRIWRRNR